MPPLFTLSPTTTSLVVKIIDDDFQAALHSLEQLHQKFKLSTVKTMTL
jgi:hypothetical protein